MKTCTPEIITLYCQIMEEFLKTETDFFIAQDRLATLDAYLISMIIKEFINKINSDKYDVLNNIIAQKAAPEKILEILGITPEEFNNKHEAALKNSLEKLQQ